MITPVRRSIRAKPVRPKTTSAYLWPREEHKFLFVIAVTEEILRRDGQPGRIPRSEMMRILIEDAYDFFIKQGWTHEQVGLDPLPEATNDGM